MNLDYRFPMFDDLLQGRLDPMGPGNELNSGYEIRLQEQIVANAHDTGGYGLKFMPPLNAKCIFYHRMLLSETFLYCEEILSYLHNEEDSRIRAYLRDTLLDNHLVTCLKKLGERIRQDGLHLSHLTNPSPESDIEHLTNVYIFQLFKVCITKAYLEIQHSLSDVVMIKQTEAMLYSAYFGEVPPVQTFLSKRIETEPVKPQKEYPDTEPKKQRVSQPDNDYKSDITQLPTEFYTIKEVSKILRVNERTVRRIIEKKEIKALKKGGKYLIDKTAFESSLKNKDNNRNTKTKTHD